MFVPDLRIPLAWLLFNSLAGLTYPVKRHRVANNGWS
jgi:hypothetical protein